MAYGIPKDAGGDSPQNVSKMESCVEKVMKTGKAKDSAIAICKTSLFSSRVQYDLTAEGQPDLSNLVISTLALEAIGRMLSQKNLETVKQCIGVLQELVKLQESKLQSEALFVEVEVEPDAVLSLE